MGLFGFGKKSTDVLDLAERYRKQKEKAQTNQESSGSSGSSSTPFPFFDLSSTPTLGSERSSAAEQDSGTTSFLESQEKRRKLAKRLADMTEKLEDLSNKIYHIEQRLEVLEKKTSVN